MRTLKVSQVVRGQDGQVKEVTMTFGSGTWKFAIVHGRPEAVVKTGPRQYLPKKLYKELYRQVCGVFYERRRRTVAAGGS